MSWNLPRIINNLEAEINTGYVKDPATRDFSLAGYDIRNANLVKCNDVETNTVFSVNDELDKLDNFEPSTPNVTTIVGKLKVDNIDTNIIYSADELTRIELDDSDINLISQNLTWNGLDVLTTANLEILENKTFYIDGSSISPDGTLFSNSIYADKYIINNGPSTAGYLMSDGTILNNSGDGVNSNIYLYNNNTTTTPIPASGQIRFNQPINENSTQLYISHRTRDGLDIEDPFLSSISTLNIIYIQDQDISENYIRFNVTSAPVIFPVSYVQLNVAFLDGNGNGLTNFGAGMNIFMSIFSNDIEIDTRLSNLETKTQNIQATSSKLTVSRSTELLIDESDFFAIRSIDGFLNYLIFNPTVTMLYNNLNLNANNLSNVSSITISGFEADNFFLKSDGTLDENDYLTETNITDLRNKTQNITGSINGTDFLDNSTFVLRVADSDIFTIRNDATPFSVSKLTVSNSSVQINNPLFMQNQRIQLLGEPVDLTDAATRSYVDSAVAGASGTLYANSSTYINASSKLQASFTNKFCQAGVDNLQLIINVMNANDTVYLSSGTHTVAVSPLNINITDISLSGAISPIGTQTTIFNNNVVLNVASTRVKFKDIYFQQSFRFGSTNLRMDFENCKFGLMEFQDGSNYVNFTDCEFTASTLQFPFVGTPVYTFTRCNMNNAIVNPNIAGMVVLDSCENVESLTQINTIYKGINTLGNGNTQLALTTSTIGFLSVNNITQAGLPPYFRQASQIATVVTSGLTETVMTTTTNFGSYSWADTAVGQSRTWKIQGTQTRGTFSGTYTIRFKSGVSGNVLNVAWALPATPSGAVSNQPFILEITTVRTFTNSLSYYAKFSSADATTAGYYLFSSQNQTGGILPLNQVARYNLTVQSSIASCSLQFNYIEVMTMLN